MRAGGAKSNVIPRPRRFSRHTSMYSPLGTCDAKTRLPCAQFHSHGHGQVWMPVRCGATPGDGPNGMLRASAGVGVRLPLLGLHCHRTGVDDGSRYNNRLESIRRSHGILFHGMQRPTAAKHRNHITLPTDNVDS